MQTGILRGMSVLAGLLWLASCSSSPKSRDYPGYMTRPYTIRGHRYHPMNVEQALAYEQTGIASHYNECALWGLVSGKTAIGENVRPWHLHAAHPTLPLPCEVLVQSLRTGKTVNPAGPDPAGGPRRLPGAGHRPPAPLRQSRPPRPLC